MPINLTNGVALFEGILTGGSPPVIIGGVELYNLEVPGQIPWGGRQMMAVHKLPGGARVIDSMGRDDTDLSWAGYLEGPTAISRALELDSLRISGAEVQLTWDTLSFTVVVSEFICHHHRRNWAPYTIRCVVVADNSAAFVAYNQPPTLLSSINSDLNSALSSLLPIASEASTALGVAQTALSVVGATTKGSSAYIGALSDLDTAQGVLTGVTTSSNTGLLPFVGSTLGILGQSTAAGAVGAIPTLVTEAGNLAGSLQQNGYTSRAYVNLQTSVS